MRKIIGSAAGFVLVVVFNLVLSEGLIRMVDMVIPLERPRELADNLPIEWFEGHENPLDGEHRLYAYKPGATGATYGHPIRINRHGFRGEEWSPSKDEGQHSYRILVLGDSLTMGQGVAEDDRYTNILQGLLQARYSSRPVEVINLGVHGFETVQEERTLQRMGDVVHPDLTIVGFYVNDTNITYEGFLPYQLPVPSSLRPYLERFLLFRVLEPWYDPVYRWIWTIPSFSEVQMRSRNVESRDWKIFAQSVRKISAWVANHSRQSPLVLFLTTEPGKQDEFYWNVRRTFEANGFVWVEPQIARYEPVSRFEFHPNRVMHRAYAEYLSKAIIESRRIEEISVSTH
jgi:lysophospholipase L1-like esterase